MNDQDSLKGAIRSAGVALIVAGVLLGALVELVVDGGPRPTRPYEISAALIALGAVLIFLGRGSPTQF